MLEPVLAMRRLHSRLKGEKHSSSEAVAVPDDDAAEVPSKKQEVSISSNEIHFNFRLFCCLSCV